MNVLIVSLFTIFYVTAPSMPMRRELPFIMHPTPLKEHCSTENACCCLQAHLSPLL